MNIKRIYVCCPLSKAGDDHLLVINDGLYVNELDLVEVTRSMSRVLYIAEGYCAGGLRESILIHPQDLTNSMRIPTPHSNGYRSGEEYRLCREVFPSDVIDHPSYYITGTIEDSVSIEIHFSVPEEV